MKAYRSLLLTLMLGLMLSAPAGAGGIGAPDGNIDSRWSPWMGCWQLMLESFDYDDERPEGEVFVCISPTADGRGVGISTWADDAVVLAETLVADARRYPVEESGCAGWRSAEWSRDGHRLFMKSELTCENDVRRSVSGVSLFVSRATWVDIQMIDSNERKELVIRRYRAASSAATEGAGLEEAPQDTEASRSARARAAGALTIEKVIEASQKVDAAVMEAVLVESDTTLHVDSHSLIRMADAHVPPSIIDLMVALSYPEHFEIRSREVGGREYWGGEEDDDAYDDYGPYAYWYPFYYAPFGYDSYYYWPTSGYYLLTPGEDLKPVKSGGKVVKGQGYTRVWPKESTSKFGGGTSKGSDWGSSADSSSSSQGYSRGSGSGSTGRTAKPKKN